MSKRLKLCWWGLCVLLLQHILYVILYYTIYYSRSGVLSGGGTPSTLFPGTEGTRSALVYKIHVIKKANSCKLLILFRTSFCSGENCKSTLFQKRVADVIGCNLKKDYQILIIFRTSIPDTTGHQMTVQVPTSPNMCFCTSWGKRNTK